MSKKIPCRNIPWFLKIINNKIISIVGICTQCKAKIVLELTGKLIHFNCKLFGYDEKFIHDVTKKIKLTPYERRKISRHRISLSATFVHKKIATKFMNFGAICPSFVPNLHTLQEIKHETNKASWFHENQILSLSQMSFTNPHSTIIKDMNLYPHFHIYYWTPEQTEYYKAYSDKCSSITLTVDATGSIFVPVTLPDKKKFTKTFYLYVVLLTANSNYKSVPVGQMITDSHSLQSIANWLSHWKQFNFRPPTEVIIDDSAALIRATVKVFTLYESTKDYINACYNLLLSPSDHRNAPNVHILLDTSHFAKTIYNYFKDIDVRIKTFYIRAILF